MKYLILFCLIMVGCDKFTETGAAQANSETVTTKLAKLSNHTCVSFTYKFKAEHSWEKERLYEELPWVLLDKDSTAIRIAQPSVHCSSNKIPLEKCDYYWDRTVGIKGSWLDGHGDFVQIECPRKLNKQNLKKVLR